MCTYLETDYYDPTNYTLDEPECLASPSYTEAQAILRCKMAFNHVQTYIWKGAIKKAHDLDSIGTSLDDSTSDN